MGALISFMNGIKKAFTNKKGKIQILPKVDFSLLAILAMVFCWFYFNPNSEQQLLIVSLFSGMVVTWSLRHIILQETPFLSYFAWVVLTLAFGISVYLIFQFAPVFL
jgi:hypothetical protein